MVLESHSVTLAFLTFSIYNDYFSIFRTTHVFYNIYYVIHTYTRVLWKRIAIFLHFSGKSYNATEKLLAGFNVQTRLV